MDKADTESVEQFVKRTFEYAAEIARKRLPAQKMPTYQSVWDSLLGMAPVDDSYPEDKPLRLDFTPDHERIMQMTDEWCLMVPEMERLILWKIADGDSWESVHVYFMRRFNCVRGLSIRTLQRKRDAAVSFIAFNTITTNQTQQKQRK